MHMQLGTEISEEMIREEHLRIAVMLDTITDGWKDSQPVGAMIIDLVEEFDRHVVIEEGVLSQAAPQLLDKHRNGHDRMSVLLHRLMAANEAGANIAPVLDDILALFTTTIMPDDAVFLRR